MPRNTLSIKTPEDFRLIEFSSTTDSNTFHYDSIFEIKKDGQSFRIQVNMSRVHFMRLLSNRNSVSVFNVNELQWKPIYTANHPHFAAHTVDSATFEEAIQKDVAHLLHTAKEILFPS